MKNSMKKTEYIGLSLESVSDRGIATIAFNTSLFNKNFTSKNISSVINKESLRISVLKAYSEEVIEIPWEFHNASDKILNVTLKFPESSQISVFKEKD
jgi:hypothetical protein